MAPIQAVTAEASSNILGFDYDPEKKELIVEFKGNRRYLYLNIPEGIVRAFQNSPSFGKFHNKNIRGKYEEVKLG